MGDKGSRRKSKGEREESEGEEKRGVKRREGSKVYGRGRKGEGGRAMIIEL